MSSDPTSTEQHPARDNDSNDDAPETMDQSLEAIMKEVQQAEGAGAPGATVPEPPRETLVEAEAETPVAAAATSSPPAEAGVEAQSQSQSAREASAPDPAPESVAASATPVPEDAETASDPATDEVVITESDSEGEPIGAAARRALDAVELVRTNVVVESILATADTSDDKPAEAARSVPEWGHDYEFFGSAQADDEALLDKVVLPATPGTPTSASPESETTAPPADRPGFEDEETVISEMSPIEAPPRLPPPQVPAETGRRITPPWPGTAAVDPPRHPIGRLPRAPARGVMYRVRQVANHRVNATVAQLAIVVVSATALGAAAVRMFGPSLIIPAAPEPTIMPESVAQPHFESLPPRPPEIAPLPSAVDIPEPVEEVEQPRARPGRRTRAARPTVAAAAAGGDATAEQTGNPAAGEPPTRTAPAAKKTTPARPRTRRVAQQSAWVDPFGD
jgi:hypothetical protein